MYIFLLDAHHHFVVCSPKKSRFCLQGYMQELKKVYQTTYKKGMFTYIFQRNGNSRAIIQLGESCILVEPDVVVVLDFSGVSGIQKESSFPCISWMKRGLP